MNSVDLRKPTRQSIKGLAIIFVQSVRAMIKMFWALIAVVVLQRDILSHKAMLPIALGVLFLVLVVHTILYYRYFFFYVNDEEFVLKKGYLRKKVLTIPLERIQSINTKQNLLQQVLNVVALEIDTAGTAGKELKIHALEQKYATALSALLSVKKENVEASSEEIQSEQTTNTAEQLILKLNPSDLLKIGISENHLKTGLIILAFGYQIFNQLQEVFKAKADEYSSEFVTFMSNSSLVLIVFLLVFFMIVTVLFSLVKTLFVYFDFSLLKTNNTYKVEAGLVNKRRVVLPHGKIQEINWETNPIKKLFGIYRIVFKQAVSKQNPQMQVVDAPGCLAHHLTSLQGDLFGEDTLSSSHKFHSNRFYFRPLWFFSGWIPVLLASPFLYNQWIFCLSAVVWLLLTAGYNYLLVKKRYFNMNNEQIRISQGAISHKWKQMELFKIQSVKYKQSFFQRRRKLATIVLMNASGSITIPYIHAELAKQIHDYLLFHTETSTKKWM